MIDTPMPQSLSLPRPRICRDALLAVLFASICAGTYLRTWMLPRLFTDHGSTAKFPWLFAAYMSAIFAGGLGIDSWRQISQSDGELWGRWLALFAIATPLLCLLDVYVMSLVL